MSATMLGAAETATPELDKGVAERVIVEMNKASEKVKALLKTLDNHGSPLSSGHTLGGSDAQGAENKRAPIE